MAAPQESRPYQAQPYHPSQNERMQHGRGRERPSKIQGAWAQGGPRGRGRGRGRGRARGRGQPSRVQEYQPFMPEKLLNDVEGSLGPGPRPPGRFQGTPSYGPQGPYHPPGAFVMGEQSGGAYPCHCPRDLQYGQMSTLQSCFGQPQNVGNEFVFIQPDEDFSVPKVAEPSLRMIEKDGEYDISFKPTGASKVQLIKHFLDEEYANEAFCQLNKEIRWKQQTNKNRAGEDYQEPRLVCWYGEHPYAYSKVKMEANEEWPPVLKELKEKIEEKTSFTFNSVLANKYRSGKDGVAWHSDDEYGLREQPKIASLSLGETRMFEMRKKPPKGYNPYDYDYSQSEKLKIPLTHGSLLMMTGHTQDDWQHQVPKEYHERDIRINLTFRTIYSD